MSPLENASTSDCRLCGKEGGLRESHVIPVFVGRWIKDTSATGDMRYLVPDRRAEDFQKVRLLCVSSLSERQRQRIADSVRENPIEPPHVHLLLQPGSTTNDSGSQTHSSLPEIPAPVDRA